MGLFDSIVGAVTGATGEDKGEGAQNILGNLLQQGMAGGQSGNIISQLIGGFGGASAASGGAGGAGGGMQSMLETLAANGLGEQVSSWLGNQSNLPISGEQIKDALGSEQVQQMASASGLPIGDFLKHLAEHLPTAASQAAGTPTGNTRPDPAAALFETRCSKSEAGSRPVTRASMSAWDPHRRDRSPRADRRRPSIPRNRTRAARSSASESPAHVGRLSRGFYNFR